MTVTKGQANLHVSASEELHYFLSSDSWFFLIVDRKKALGTKEKKEIFKTTV